MEAFLDKEFIFKESAEKDLKIDNSMAIKNPASYTFLLFMGMLYMSVMLLNAVVTNCYIGTDGFFLLGGAFVSPFLFVLNDIISEIYGYKLMRTLVFSGFFCQTIFALVAQFIVNAPHPSSFTEFQAYNYILGFSLLRIDVSGFIAYIVANLLNSYLITKWKILLNGRYFWLRSIGASTIAEALYSLIAVVMIKFGSLPSIDLIKIAMVIYLIKAMTSILFSVPSQYFVTYFKYRVGVDVYELPGRARFHGSKDRKDGEYNV